MGALAWIVIVTSVCFSAINVASCRSAFALASSGIRLPWDGLGG